MLVAAACASCSANTYHHLFESHHFRGKEKTSHYFRTIHEATPQCYRAVMFKAAPVNAKIKKLPVVLTTFLPHYWQLGESYSLRKMSWNKLIQHLEIHFYFWKLSKDNYCKLSSFCGFKTMWVQQLTDLIM